MRNTITKQEIEKQIEENKSKDLIKYSVSEETDQLSDFIELDTSFPVEESTMDLVFHIFSYENQVLTDNYSLG